MERQGVVSSADFDIRGRDLRRAIGQHGHRGSESAEHRDATGQTLRGARIA